MTIMDRVGTKVETSRWGGDPVGAELTNASIRFSKQTPVVFVISIETRAPIREPERPFKVARDDDGSYIVSDRYDYVAGVGSNLQEAQHDFFVSLAQQLAYLRSNHERLHPRLQESRRRLERAFPWT
jgi:hypothetical protein